MISVVLVLSASEDDVDDDGDDPSPRTTLLCRLGEDSGGFDYDIVRRRVPDAARLRWFKAAFTSSASKSFGPANIVSRAA